MNKSFKIILLLLITFLIIPFAFSDGGVVIKDRDMWFMLTEEQQYCAINYKDGIQYMILSVDTAEELRGDKAVWIFPVPADPEETNINILMEFPELRGSDLSKQANSALDEAYILMTLTQIYPAFFTYFGVLNPGSMLASRGVTVHESLEKMGLTTELISAQDSASFNNYLAGKELELPPNFKSILDEYIGQEYAFVISWISNIAEFRNAQEASSRSYYSGRRRAGNTIAVFISFPTEKIFYPLKPTSVYGDKVVPAVIYVMDHVQPEAYSDIKSKIEVSYFTQRYFTAPDELRTFFTGFKTESEDVYSDTTPHKIPGFEIKELNYTKIKIEAPSNDLTQDLWIKNKAPNKIVIYSSLVKHRFLWGLIIFILLSCLSSLIAGRIIFRNDKPSLIKLFFFGLFNFITLLGFWIVAYLMDVEHRFTEKEKVISQSVNLSKKQKITIALPIIIIVLLALLIFLINVLDLHYVYYALISISAGLGIFFGPAMLFLPFIFWGHYKHKKTLYFNLVFSGIFLVLLIFSRILLLIII